MKLMIKLASTLALSTVVMSGCQSVSNTAQTQPLTYDILRGHDWQLVDAKDTKGQTIAPLFTQQDNPLTLSFVRSDGQDILSLNNTCNRFSAPYTVNNGNVDIGHFMTTMMACPEPQASFDRAAGRAVMGKYSLNSTNGQTVLTISSNDGIANFKEIPKS